MMSGPTSKHHDEELMLVDDECQIVSDQLKGLSDRFEPELVCLDEEEKNPGDKDFLPMAEEGSQVKEALHADTKPNEVELAPELVDGAAEPDNPDYNTFSMTNHRFDIIFSKSHFSPHYNVFLPRKIVQELPRNNKVPVVLNSNGKIWTMFYNGHLKAKTFSSGGWRKFLDDNKLKVGDACFFELLENSPKKMALKVVILKTASPSSVEAADDGTGTSAEKPIVVVD